MPALQLPRLSGDGLVLRAMTDTDVPLVLDAATDPLIPHITTVPPEPDPAEARAYIARQHDRVRTGEGYSFAIADAGSDEALGQLGVWLYDLGQGRASVGYWVGSRHRGHRVAERALRLASTWALELPGVARLDLYAEPGNVASWRTAERVGYRREGLLRSWQPVGAERRDMYAYGLLPGDLAPRRDGPPVQVLLIGGRAGVGKTTVGYEVSEQLQAADVTHCLVDGDNLDAAYPKPGDDPHGARMTEENLAALWSTYVRAGQRRIVYVNTVSVLEPDLVVRAVGGSADVVAVLLTASDDTAAARLALRETGTGLTKHLHRSRQAARELDAEAPTGTVRMDTDDRTVAEVARQVIAASRWASAVPAQPPNGVPLDDSAPPAPTHASALSEGPEDVGLRLQIEEAEDAALAEQLSQALTAHNRAATGVDEEGSFAVKMQDQDGGLVGGLTGWTWGASAGIHLVWVREDARRTGIGTRLLEAAEAVATRRGCDRIFVSSCALVLNASGPLAAPPDLDPHHELRHALPTGR